MEAVIVVPVWQERVLLLQRSNDERSYPGLFAFPRGQKNDTESVRASVTRIVVEQTGLHAGVVLELPGDDSVLRLPGKVFSIHRYLTWHRNRPTVSPDLTKIGYVWVTCDEARSMPLAGPIVREALDLIPVALETFSS